MRYFWSCFLLVLLAGPLAAASPAPLYISGRVLAKGDHSPVAGASVSLFVGTKTEPAAVTQTLQNGGFILRAPDAGKYRLTVQHRTYATVEQSIQAPVRGVQGLELLMVARPLIHLHLLAPDGKAVAHGQVQVAAHVSWPGGDQADYANMDATPDGAVDLPLQKLAPLERIDRVLISVRALESGCAQLYLNKWPEAAVTVSLEQGATLSGSVVDGAGKPLPTAPIIAIRLFNDGRLVAMEQHAIGISGADGKFEIPALFYGSYVVVAQTPEVSSGPRLIVLSEPRTEMQIRATEKVKAPQG